MAKAKQPKQPKLSDTPLEPVTEAPLVQEPVTFPQGTCIQCRHLQTGQWYGPRCTNPASPEYKNHRPDSGTCEKYEPKLRQPLPVVADDGLYDPDPVATAPSSEDTLAALLDRETETPEAPDNAI